MIASSAAVTAEESRVIADSLIGLAFLKVKADRLQTFVRLYHST
jgi:hypothetical protein